MGLAADDAPAAQEAAWNAVQLSTVARERRYALSLLAEAYRKDNSLDKLIDRFAGHAGELQPEVRNLWIELLRERERYDDAIQLVQHAREQAGFSDEQQQALFEMFREAGREQDLLDAYQSRIAAEPDNLAWLEGLSRYYLEQGNRDQALAVWQPWITRHAGRPDLLGAESMQNLGLDEPAIAVAQEASTAYLESEPLRSQAAQLFLFNLYHDRGRLDEAAAVLVELDRTSAPDAPVRIQLSDAFERLGDQRRAVDVLRSLVQSRPPGEAGEDVEMRLAWLLSEVGDEEEALEQWRLLWQRVKSVPRRRYVEDRLMTVASRLGTLADVAVELEQKLYQGTATELESGLLVRLYTKVGDAVSAAEIIDEFMRRSGSSEIETLTEKARVYLACTDYFHYEEAVRRLIELDPEGEGDYLRQLAMSQLERGKPKEAREVLMRLGTLEAGDSASAEFEAGVLALSGMREEAVAAYRRGLAVHPDRIDAYILMAGLMKEIGQSDEAVGMFQYLAETADKDDLFTIAIDGILNMLVDAPPRPKTVQWARRVTLERIARRHDKPYLFQLLSDLSAEVQDTPGQMLALESALPGAGPRRGSLLRELMDLAKGDARGRRGGDSARHLAMGRRLIGLEEAVPPQVYLDLGEAFLKAKDGRSAERTFALTRSLPDGPMYQRQAAAKFEGAGFVERARGMYEAVLATQPSDVPLICKVAEVQENLGEDAAAHQLYARAMDLMLRRRALRSDSKEAEDEVPEDAWYANLNVDDFEQNHERVWSGLVATMGAAELSAWWAAQTLTWTEELEQAKQLRAEWTAAAGPEDKPVPLERFPRLQSRSDMMRRTAMAWGRMDLADGLDQPLVQAFPGDEALLENLVRERLRWGQVGSARALIELGSTDAEARKALLVRVGEVVEVAGGASIPLAEAARQVLPLVAEGRTEELTAVVRRADLGKIAPEEAGQANVMFAAARFLNDGDLVLKVGRDLLRKDMDGERSYRLTSTLETVAQSLSPENSLSAARYVVGRIFDDPEKYSSLATALPEIARKYSEPLVESEQVLKLLEGFGEKYTWGMDGVIGLLPPADRGAALRSIWAKVEKSERALLLLQLLTRVDGELGEELEQFIRDNMSGTLADGPEYLEYYISELGQVRDKPELLLFVIEQLEKAGFDRLKFMPTLRAMQLKRAGRMDEAVDLIAHKWMEQVMDDEWRSREMLDDIRREFLPDHLQELANGLEGYKEDKGDSAGVRRAQLWLLESVIDADRARYEAALDDAVEAFPDDDNLLEESADYYSGIGNALREAELRRQWIETHKDKQQQKSAWGRLRAIGRQLQDPVLELEARNALRGIDGKEEIGGASMSMVAMVAIGPGTMVLMGDPEEDEGKGLPKSVLDLKSAFEAGKVAEAGRILRRMWRSFPVGEPQQNRYFYYSRRPRLAQLNWPRDAAEDERPGAAGGLVGARDMLRWRTERKRQEEANPAPKAFEILCGNEELEQELWRFVRTQDSGQLDQLGDLFRGLLQARRHRLGEQESLAQLIEAVRNGQAGKIDKILLLASLSEGEGGLPAEAASVLADLPRTVSARDAAQIQRLARVYAKGGRTDVARALFHWCSTQATSGSCYGFDDEDFSPVSVQALVEDAKDLFEGEERTQVIEQALSLMNPGEYPWAREQFDRLVLTTWSEVLPGNQALARARARCEAALDLGQGLHRETAKLAAGLFARGGDLDHASQALEVSLATFQPEQVTQPSQRWYHVETTVPGSLDDGDLEWIFPSGLGELPRADAAWLTRGAQTLVALQNADRLPTRNVVRAIAWIAMILVDEGQAAEALAFAAPDRPDPSWNAATRLAYLDAQRAAGDGASALAAEGELRPGTAARPTRAAALPTGRPESGLGSGAHPRRRPRPSRAFDRRDRSPGRLGRNGRRCGRARSVESRPAGQPGGQRCARAHGRRREGGTRRPLIGRRDPSDRRRLGKPGAPA
ncbi:MAG: hypothetical protein R3F17_02585 [Planctomycetota bacterium]